MIANYLYYNILVIVSLSLAYVSEKNERAIGKVCLFLLFSIVFVFTAIRFDVGPDYYNYVQAYKTLSQANYPIQVPLDYQFFKALSIAFSSYERGYLAVLAIYFFITFLFVILSLRKYGVLTIGLAVFFGFGFYFDSMDRVRQFLSLSIFLYAMSDIVDNKPMSYYLKIALASLFHMSSLFLLPMYFVARLRVRRTAVLIMFFIALIIGFFGYYNDIIRAVYDLVPFYSERYSGTTHAVNVDQFNSKIGFYTKVLFVFVVVYFSVIDEKLRTILFVGLMLMMLASGNLNIGRISSYFLVSLVLIVPLMIRNTTYNWNKVFIVMPLLLYLFVLFQFDMNRNNFEYKTVFSGYFKHEVFEGK